MINLVVPLPWLTLILVSIIATSAAIVAIIGLCRAWTWFHKKKEFFDKLGRELDDKFINASVDEVGNDKSKEYGMTNFGDKNGRKPSYSRADSKDSMEVIIFNPLSIYNLSLLVSDAPEQREKSPRIRKVRHNLGL